MKILFSPAETKKSGGVEGEIKRSSFIFPELFDPRKEAIEKYNSYLENSSDEALSKLFGIKESAKFQKYKTNLNKLPLMKVIERYDGVAFDYLAYSSLDEAMQHYIDKNVILFSNLFGPLLAGDFGVPEYKLKQGEKIGAFVPEQFYKKHFSAALNEMLKEEPYLDLRAGFYDKFYKPTTSYTTLKFIKDGKVVSHWAKAYRGIVLRILAQNNIQSMENFMEMDIEGLAVKEVVCKNIHTEIVYEIISNH